MTSKAWLASCAAGALSMAAGTAWAQEPAALEEVVVTAQKRTEDVQDVPVSVLAFGAAALERLNAQQLGDIERAAPNVSFGSGAGGSFNAIGVRGVIDSSRNIGVDARVSVYVDGVYVGRSYATDQSLLGIERVEVLRGPQGTLYGKNTVAGALNITTQKPGDTLAGQAEVELGSYDYRRLAGRFNLPLGDTAALSVSVARETRDGYIRNVTRNTDLNGVDRWAGRVQLRLRPTDRLTLDFAADALDEGQPFVLYEGLGGTAARLAPGPFTIAHDTDERDSRSYAGLSASADYQITDDLTLTSITAFRKSRYDFLQEEDYLPTFVARSNFNERSRQFTQELRLASSETERFSWLAGVFYMDEELETNRLSEGGPALRNGFVRTPGSIQTRSAAAFAHVNYDITPQLKVNGGLRLTYERKSLDFSIVDTMGLFTNFENFRDKREDTDLSPKIGVQYYPSEEVMLFASLSRGFKSGGWNADTITTLEGIAFDPEEATSFEAGLKSTLFERRLRLNLTGFVTRYEDYQVFQFITLSNGGTLITFTNAGEVTTQGLEAEIEAVPVSGLTLSASGAYTEAKFDSFADGGGLGVNYDGHDLPYAPRTKFYLGADYRLPVGPGEASFHVDYSYTGDQYVSSSNSAASRLPGYGLVNARVSYAFDNGWEISAFGQNLADKRYLRTHDTSFLGSERGRYGMPRTYGVRLKTTF